MRAPRLAEHLETPRRHMEHGVEELTAGEGPGEGPGPSPGDAAMEEPATEPVPVKKSRWASVGGAVKVGVRTTLAAQHKRRAEDEAFMGDIIAELEGGAQSREEFEEEFESRMRRWSERNAHKEETMRDRHQEQFYHLRTRLKGLELEASITSAPVAALRRKQQSLLAGKRYAEAFDHMKVRAAAWFSGHGPHRGGRMCGFELGRRRPDVRRNGSLAFPSFSPKPVFPLSLRGNMCRAFCTHFFGPRAVSRRALSRGGQTRREGGDARAPRRTAEGERGERPAPAGVPGEGARAAQTKNASGGGVPSGVQAQMLVLSPDTGRFGWGKGRQPKKRASWRGFRHGSTDADGGAGG